MSDYDSDDYAADPNSIETVFDPALEKERYIEHAAKHHVWDHAYFRMAQFAADALALIGPSGVATIRRFTGAGCTCLLIHAKRHVFRVYFESLSNKGQRIQVEAESLNDDLHALIPVFEGLESSRSWSKVLRQIARFESTCYLDSFMIEEQRWEDEREEREERRRREQQQGEENH
jgi:heme oxygenase